MPPLPARHHTAVSATTSADSALTTGSAMDANLARLMAEGFDDVNARRALKLAKNNIELARGILKEFVPSVSSGW